MCAIAVKCLAQGTQDTTHSQSERAKKSAANEAAPRFGDFSLNAKVYFSRNVV